MPATIVLGAQWGDEGKGRVTDLFARDADFVVRYQGGNNAGHTIIIGDEHFALSSSPLRGHVSGSHTHHRLGGGDRPQGVADRDRHARRPGSEHLQTTDICKRSSDHALSPQARRSHGAVPRSQPDRHHEERASDPPTPTSTPATAFVCKTSTTRTSSATRSKRCLSRRTRLLTRVYNQLPMNADEIVDEYLELADRLLPMVDDTSFLIWDALQHEKHVLFEGAQGTLLDIDHGTYPFVTSSNPTAGGATIGSGIGPKAIDSVVGVAKAYISRVGSGPFPTELFDDDGETMVNVGGEYGVVTGRRRRRCGWLDLVALRYSCRVNSLTELFITKLDILSEFDTIKVATAYTSLGETYTEFPRQQRVLYNCAPVLEEFAGWNVDISGITRFDKLPKEAQQYIEFIGERTGVPVKWVSVGPERSQTDRPRLTGQCGSCSWAAAAANTQSAGSFDSPSWSRS